MNLEYLYIKFKNQIFQNRYIDLNLFYKFTNVNFLKKEIIGYSVQNKPIYLIKIGKGKKKILIWSQMHGNESTGTLAMLDLLNILKNDVQNTLFKNMLQKYEIHYIPILNPDGAKNWKRNNAQNIDLNRDFNTENSKEIKILKKQFKNINYILGFNLHDQRTIFSVGNSVYPATLSFLSPSIDYIKSINNVRKKSMGIITSIYNNLQNYIPYQIARYSDEFYPNSIGDNLQKLNIPTILFEAGHFHNDYNRNYVRKYFCFSLIYALKFITEENNWQLNYLNYFKIPKNSNRFTDLIIKSAKFYYNNKIIITDCAIQYYEKVNKLKLQFIPIITQIGNLNTITTWKLINGLKLPIFNINPKIGHIINYNFFNL